MSTDDAVGGAVVTEPITVGLSAVESALTKLWKHQEVTPGSSQGVLTRACMSNLIIVCEGKTRADAITRDVTEIVRRHPSRVILLVVDVQGPGIAAPLEASVSAHCHLTGEDRQVCSELVTIGAGCDEVRKLPSAARSLLVGDLPTSLWWDAPEPPPLGGDLFCELNPMADQVLYSSQQWDDPVRGTLALNDWITHDKSGELVVMDLSWRQLRRWRHLISQSLDPVALPGALDALESVEIEHGPRGLPQAWLLAGWLASALGWTVKERTVVRGREMSWRLQKKQGELTLIVRKHDDGDPRIRRVHTVWKAGGKTAALTFTPAGTRHLTATPEGFDAETRVLASQPSTCASMVAAELQRLEPDLPFFDALRVSRKLAENLDLA